MDTHAHPRFGLLEIMALTIAVGICAVIAGVIFTAMTLNHSQPVPQRVTICVSPGARRCVNRATYDASTGACSVSGTVQGSALYILGCSEAQAAAGGK